MFETGHEQRGCVSKFAHAHDHVSQKVVV